MNRYRLDIFLRLAAIVLVVLSVQMVVFGATTSIITAPCGGIDVSFVYDSNLRKLARVDMSTLSVDMPVVLEGFAQGVSAQIVIVAYPYGACDVVIGANDESGVFNIVRLDGNNMITPPSSAYIKIVSPDFPSLPYHVTVMGFDNAHWVLTMGYTVLDVPYLQTGFLQVDLYGMPASMIHPLKTTIDGLISTIDVSGDGSSMTVGKKTKLPVE